MPPFTAARRFGLLVATFAAAALSVAGQAAAAETRVVSSTRHGMWTASEVATAGGRRFCMLGAIGPSSLAPGSIMGFTLSVRPHGGLHLLVSKTTWSIPAGTRVAVRLHFGAETPWHTDSADGEGDSVSMGFSPRQTTLFLAEFSAASRAVVRFSGNERPWELSLSGSAAAARALLDCVQRVNGGLPDGPTQPFSAAPPQPAAPSQPYTPAPTAAGAARRT